MLHLKSRNRNGTPQTQASHASSPLPLDSHMNSFLSLLSFNQNCSLFFSCLFVQFMRHREHVKASKLLEQEVNIVNILLKYRPS